MDGERDLGGEEEGGKVGGGRGEWGGGGMVQLRHSILSRPRMED